MNKPVQFLVTPSGQRLAVLTEDDYARLLEQAEDAADARALRESDRRLAAGADEMVPWSVATRLHDGESPVRVWREYRGLDVRTLAENAGISRAYLSQIEGGKRDGTFRVMMALARVLAIDLDDLAPVDRNAPPGKARPVPNRKPMAKRRAARKRAT
jgi:DNA-binding XRE family transcriptional regulator